MMKFWVSRHTRMSALGSVGLKMTMSSRAMVEGELEVASDVNAGVSTLV